MISAETTHHRVASMILQGHCALMAPCRSAKGLRVDSATPVSGVKEKFESSMPDSDATYRNNKGAYSAKYLRQTV